MTTPNLHLDIPTVGAAGTSYATKINDALTRIDTAHAPTLRALGAVGDGVADDTAACQAAAALGRRIKGEPGVYRIVDEVKFAPNGDIGADLDGDGMWQSTFLLDHADARITFSDGSPATDGLRGSRSGGFSIDGNGLATVGLFLGLGDDRSFDDIMVRNCDGTGVVIDELNNGSFKNCVVAGCPVGWDLKNGAFGNTFWKPETYDCGIFWRGADLYNTRVVSGISEHFDTPGAPTFERHVDLSAASNSNSWTDHLFVCVTPPSASVPFIKLRDSFVTHLTRCTLQGAPGLGVGIDADCPGLTAAILDRTTFNNLECSYKLDDTTVLEVIGNNPSVNVTTRFRNQPGGTNTERNLVRQEATPGAGFSVGGHVVTGAGRSKTSEIAVYEGNVLIGYIDVGN